MGRDVRRAGPAQAAVAVAEARIVTHEIGFAREVADRVVFMADGRIVEEAKPEEFFTNPKSDRAKDFLAKILDH